jgi:hypothetical protein
VAAKPGQVRQRLKSPLRNSEDEAALLQSILRYIRTKVRLSGNLTRDFELRRKIKARASRPTQRSRAA